jgi:2-polyprenyl-3-methyl-5-hydroxy-6-metoxy-1,4-benzoquinol methylase
LPISSHTIDLALNLNPPQAGEKMNYKEHYRQDALEFDYWGADQFSPLETRRNETIFKLCPVKAGDKVLDIGSGRGWFSLYAAEKGAEVTALDLSDDNLKRIKTLNPAINTIYGDACDVPIINMNFDWIVALEVVEHLVDPKTAILNWKALLKPEGKLVITVPYKEQIRYSLCIHCNQKTPFNAHLHSFDKDTLIKLVLRGGYWVKDTELFMNKLLISLKLTNLIKKLPYSYWSFLDKFMGMFSMKYNYIALIATLKK